MTLQLSTLLPRAPNTSSTRLLALATICIWHVAAHGMPPAPCKNIEELEERYSKVQCQTLPTQKQRLLMVGESQEFPVYARCRKNWSGVGVETRAVYRIEVGQAIDWCDKGIPGQAPYGFKNPPGFWLRLFFPLKRRSRPCHTCNWFQLLGSIDSTPENVFPIDPQSELNPPAEGELFLFVNDAKGYYDNNFGVLRVRITRQR